MTGIQVCSVCDCSLSNNFPMMSSHVPNLPESCELHIALLRLPADCNIMHTRVIGACDTTLFKTFSLGVWILRYASIFIIHKTLRKNLVLVDKTGITIYAKSGKRSMINGKRLQLSLIFIYILLMVSSKWMLLNKQPSDGDCKNVLNGYCPSQAAISLHSPFTAQFAVCIFTTW